MLWVTKRRIRIARAATCWLINRIDAEAELRFVADEEVGKLQRECGAIGFHASGAKYPTVDDQGRVAFQALAAEYCPADNALARLGRIVHDADRGGRAAREAEAVGVRAILVSLPDVCDDDNAIVGGTKMLFDALYATLRKST